MRNLNANFQLALTNSRDNGIVPRTFVYFTAKDRSTVGPVSLGLWTGDEDINITVISATTGLPEARTYFGAVNLDIDDIPRVSDMSEQTITVSMSQVADAAQQLVRGYDVRLAKVEIHEMTLDVVTRQPTSDPQNVFLGEVDGAPITTPAAGEEGSIKLNVVSDAISMLNRANPLKSSHEGQKRRSNDQWGKYSSTIDTWNIPWGTKG